MNFSPNALPKTAHPATVANMTSNSSPFERNRVPILEKLRPLIKEGSTILELGSGTGDHSQYFAAQCPDCLWQTTERAENFALLCQAIKHGSRSDVAPPVQLDLLDATWNSAFETQNFDVALAINVIHIAKWEATHNLMVGVSKILKPDGLLITYGPYRYKDQELEPSNASFEQWIQSKYPGAGLRVLEEVQEEAEAQGLSLIRDHAMPANNRLLVFQAMNNPNS